ncbi:MAG: AAA domain-containing protein, partial [Candidatus Magnetominusculus sp. LBB02]|nr:AAA domain-containing protein [Candidatus Magnetominusculus sp. LBB02]
EYVFVSGGYRDGSKSKTVNPPEANAIVEKIVELCKDSRYSGKTMGVIVLQGEAQADRIERELLKHLGAEEMGRRRLICGNPYSFQGDERDIIFLSMVAATNERIGSLTKAADGRRFNVAASRARDQVFLFHSVTVNDLGANCLRRRLLEYFQDTREREISGIKQDELERKAVSANRCKVDPPEPFDSWFEVDVALELLRKGYEVVAQYEFAGYWIDLVVEGGQARLAVECDGDHWHGIEQYEYDMQRQRQLERCKWVFFRVRGAAFYSNKEEALKDLWPMLEERGIAPKKPHTTTEVYDETETDNQHVEQDSNEPDKDEQSLPEDNNTSGIPTSRRPENIHTSEISNAIINVLKDCPNNSCTVDSLTKRVLSGLAVITRGKPREAFEKRVMRCLVDLENRDLVEKYKAKNKRVRLIRPQYSLFMPDTTM